MKNSIKDITTRGDYLEAVALLNVWRDAYYNGRQLAIDSEYDALYRMVLVFEAKHPEAISKDSPSHFVGAPVIEGGFAKAKHKSPMLSIRDAFSEAELEAFDRNLKQGESVTYLCEAKYDGASLNLIYEDRKLVSAITRGDGQEGDDITATIATGAVRGIPMELPATHPDQCEVRGEVMISFEAFKSQNERRAAKGEELYANPRNLAAGSLRQLDPNEVSRRELFFIPYQLVGSGLATQSQIAELLECDSFIGGAGRMIVKGASGLKEAYRHFESIRDTLAFQLDGMVAKVDDIALQTELGAARRHPHWAIAGKFKAEESITKINDVIVQVGKNGAQTPVAILEPVQIAGTTVSRATLNNFAHIDSLDIRIGDSISILKSGDIIPMVTGVYTDRRSGGEVPIETPTHCACCGGQLERETLKGGERSTALYCKSDTCEGRRARYIEYICSRSILDINIGEKTADLLVEHHGTIDIFDLLSLDKSALMMLPKFGEKKAEKLLASIQSAKGATLDKAIVLLTSRVAGAGIGVGRSIAKTLVAELGDDAIRPDALRAFRLHGTADEVFVKLGDLLEEKSEELHAILSWLEITMPSTIKNTTQRKEELMNGNGKLTGESIVLTGKMLRKRSDYEALLQRHGAHCESRVTGETTVLLTAEENPTSSKAKAAAKKGIRVAQVEAFMAEHGIAFESEAA